MFRGALSRATSKRRTVVYALAAAFVVLLLIAGLAFANSMSVARVTENARSLHWTNATIGTSALTRAGLAQAVTFSELESEGLASEEDLGFAMDQVRSSLEELAHLTDLGIAHDSHELLSRFFDAASSAFSALEAGDRDAARAQTTTEVETHYVELINSLRVEQDEIQNAIDNNSEAGRALNGWVVFVLTLAVPGSAIGVYFIVARRQMRDFKARVELELEAERAINHAKDDFIAGLSHELRTPLTSIYGFAEVLADGHVTGSEATQETASIIANEASELSRLVDDLLVAARLVSTGIEVELADTRVADVIESAIDPFERAGLVVQRQPTSLIAATDAARLRHILINLLSNAARYGGPEIGIEVEAGDGVVQIEVWDNGPGVDPERVETLFKRFIHDGSSILLTGTVGLGLAVGSRLADLLGGELRYQRFGNKTYFTVTLPLAGEASSADEEESVSEMIKALSG